MSKSVKFLVTCGVVFVLGAAICLTGYATGGAKQLKDGSVTAVETVTDMEDYEFDSIDITGYADVKIAGSRYYSDVLEDVELTEDNAKAGRVIIISDKNKAAPEVSVDGSTLVINGGSGDSGISLPPESLFVPTVIVLCDDKELTSIKANSSAIDIDVKGVSFADTDIQVNSGDIDMKDVVSGGIKIVADEGDIEISGMLSGTTDIHTEAGDIEVDVFSGLADYTMDLSTEAGEITVGENECGSKYSQEGGDKTLKLRTDAGEIEVDNR